MKKSLLKISLIGAACSLLSATAWAQSDQPGKLSTDNPTRSWSTKQLSATGRMNEQPVRASKIMGAQVNDSSGNRAGQIQDIIVNPVSGRVDFAVLSLGAGSAADVSGKLVPVPWALLKTSSSSSSQYATSSEQPAFTINADQNKLNSAPTLNWSDMNQSEWRQRVYAYYGVTPPPVGGAESPGGEQKGQGQGARKLLQPAPESSGQNAPPPSP